MFKQSFPCLMQIRSQAQFQDLCQQHVRGEVEGGSRGGCCPSWSLGNYLAVLTNASCCLSLTSHQVVQLSLFSKRITHEQHTVTINSRFCTNSPCVGQLVNHGHVGKLVEQIKVHMVLV